MSKLDYNKIMEELENCLGLEKPAMESVSTKGVKSATESYDEVESELAGELGLEIPEEKIEGEVAVEEEKTPKEIFTDALNTYLDFLCQDGCKPDEAAEIIRKDVAEVLDPIEEAADPGQVEETPAKETPVEGTPEVEVKTEVATADEGCGVKESAGETPAVEKSAQEAFTSGEISAKEFLDRQYDEMRSKMLARYESLCSGTMKAAIEGVNGTEPQINEGALNKVSREFGYDGRQLKEIIVAALKEGVI